VNLQVFHLQVIHPEVVDLERNNQVVVFPEVGNLECINLEAVTLDDVDWKGISPSAEPPCIT
jgi:hypothetical protein